MLRVLWILSLASLTIGARRPPWDKDFVKNILAWASSDQPLECFLPGYLVPDSESLSENPCEYFDTICHPDSSTTSKASPVAKPGTRDDYGLDFDLPFQRIPVGGSTRGIPGEDFPDFVDFPATSFSCSDQEWLPGYYADLESRCQVFHGCSSNWWDSFLCPVGKTFNQAILACDHWYNSNCSLAPHYYRVNNIPELLLTKGISEEELLRILITDPVWMALILHSFPVKSKINILPETSDSESKTFAKRTKRPISTTESQDLTQEPQSTTEATVTEEAQHSTQSPDCPEMKYINATTEATVTEKAQHSTQSPDCPEMKYINAEEAVTLILDRLDNLVKDIIREAKDLKAASDAKKSCSTVHTDKISVSEKIERKFYPRPLGPPIGKEREPVITSKADAAVYATADCHKKPVDSRIKRSRRTIPPLTKTALINYIKLLLKLKASYIYL